MAKSKSPPSTELTALELFAVRQVGKAADKIRDQLPAGTVGQVDLEVRVKGMVSVGMPQPREEREPPELALLFALALDSLPTAARQPLEKKLNALFDKDLGDEWPEASPQMRQVAELAIDRWTRRHQKTQRGPVTAMIQAEVLARH